MVGSARLISGTVGQAAVAMPVTPDCVESLQLIYSVERVRRRGRQKMSTSSCPHPYTIMRGCACSGASMTEVVNT